MMSNKLPDSPFVSVIMPVRNERQAIRKSLGAVLGQDYPHAHLEILIADGMSDDGTREIIQELAAENCQVRLIENPERIMAAGFNRALSEARGDVIVMLGGHTEIAPDYLRHCVDVLKQNRAECVGGPIETVCENRNAEAIALAMSSPFGVGGVAFRTGIDQEEYVDTVAFGAYARWAIDKAGPLDKELVRNQDDEYNYRLRKMGARFLLVPQVHSRYSSRGSLRNLWKQYYQYGYWKVRVTQKHPRQMRPRHFVPAVFVTVLVVLAILAPMHWVGSAFLAGVVALYGAANITASLLVAARRRRWRLLPLLPVTFATLHLAYGIGYIVGLIRFWNRWGDQGVQAGPIHAPCKGAA